MFSADVIFMSRLISFKLWRDYRFVDVSFVYFILWLFLLTSPVDGLHFGFKEFAQVECRLSFSYLVTITFRHCSSKQREYSLQKIQVI